MTNAAPGWYPDPTQPHTQRYWDGYSWTEQRAPLVVVIPSNGAATASLVLGIIAFVFTPIPFFIGLILGGIPAILAIISGIIGLNRVQQSAGRGNAAATIGLILGGLAFFSIFIGAGTLW